jgi:2,4-dienoyl-CoA reductase-like NADH-dependent reductase (Old Yellow Enzyme family)
MLLELVERHLRCRRMTPTRFGREAVKDPNFVRDLREGREPRSATVRRVRDYIAAQVDQDLGPGLSR